MPGGKDIGASRLTGREQRREAAAERLADDSARRARLAGDVTTSSARTIGQASAHSFGAARVPQSHVAAPRPRSVTLPAGKGAGPGAAATAAAPPRPSSRPAPALSRPSSRLDDASPAQKGGAQQAPIGRQDATRAAASSVTPARQRAAAQVSRPAPSSPVMSTAQEAPTNPVPDGSTLATSSVRAAEAGSRMTTSADRRAALASRSSTWSSRRIGEAQAHSFSVGGETPWTGPTGQGAKRAGLAGGLAARAASQVKASAAGDKQAGGVAVLAAAAESKLLHRGGYRAALSVAAAAGGKDSAAAQADHAWQTASSAKSKVKRAVKAGKSVARGTRFVATHAAKGDLVSATKKAAVGGVQKRYQKLRYAFSLSRRINKLKATAQVIRGHGLGTWAKSVASAFAKQTLSGIKAGIIKLVAPVLVVVAVVVGAGALLTVGTSVLNAFAASVANQHNQAIEGLTDYEQVVVAFLREKGMDDVHIAAILANFSAESQCDPECVQWFTLSEKSRVWTDEELYAISSDEDRGVGLGQWTCGRRVNLFEWAREAGKSWRDISTQLEFFWEHDIWGTGWFGGSGEDYGSEERFNAATDPAEAARQFCLGWERAAGGVKTAEVRAELAKSYYALLTAGGKGQEYQLSSEQQRAIVDACYAITATERGWCAKWCSQVYELAGLPYESGNACDLYSWYCKSSDRSQLKVGMLVASPSVAIAEPHSAGRTYGHVGIYVGDNKVMHSTEGEVRTTDLDEWIRTYHAPVEPVMWGFPTGVAVN